jgi:hypothetical protein
MWGKYEKDVSVAAANSLCRGCLLFFFPNNPLPLQELLSLVIGFAFGFSRVFFAHTLGRPHNIMCKIFAVVFPSPASNTEQRRSKSHFCAGPTLLRPMSARSPNFEIATSAKLKFIHANRRSTLSASETISKSPSPHRPASPPVASQSPSPVRQPPHLPET